MPANAGLIAHEDILVRMRRVLQELIASPDITREGSGDASMSIPN